MTILTTVAETTATEATTATTTAPDVSVTLGNLERILEEFINSFIVFLPTLVTAIIVLILGFILTKISLKLISKGLKKSKMDPTILSFVRSFIKVALYLIVFVIVLAVLNIPTTSIVAVIGSAGIAIGLALQSSMGNLAGGFVILFSKPFVVGDYIKIADVDGTVDAISILYTKLLTIDNKAIFIPNGQISTATLINYTEQDVRRLDLVFSIAYENDFKKAKSLIRDVVEANPLSLLETDPVIRVCEQADSSINICCRVWVKSENYWDLNFDLLEGVKTQFDENGISIPFNQLDVNLKNPK